MTATAGTHAGLLEYLEFLRTCSVSSCGPVNKRGCFLFFSARTSIGWFVYVDIWPSRNPTFQTKNYTKHKTPFVNGSTEANITLYLVNIRVYLSKSVWNVRVLRGKQVSLLNFLVIT